MATYEQMVQNLAEHFECDMAWSDNTDKSWGYCLAIGDMFGKDPNEVAKDMRQIIDARDAQRGNR